MAHVIASEARLVVRLDTQAAEEAARHLPSAPAAPQAAPGSPGGPDTPPPLPGAPRPPTKRPGAGGNNGSAFDPAEHAKSLAKGIWGGGLYDRVSAGLATVPALGTGIRVAEGVREYGPALSAGIDAVVNSVKDPLVRGALMTLTLQIQAAQKIAEATTTALDVTQAKLDSVGETIQEVKELAQGAGALAGLDSSKLPGFGADLYKVNSFISEGDMIRRRRTRAFFGQAVGTGGADLLNSMFGGRSVR